MDSAEALNNKRLLLVLHPDKAKSFSIPLVLRCGCPYKRAGSDCTWFAPDAPGTYTLSSSGELVSCPCGEVYVATNIELQQHNLTLPETVCAQSLWEAVLAQKRGANAAPTRTSAGVVSPTCHQVRCAPESPQNYRLRYQRRGENGDAEAHELVFDCIDTRKRKHVFPDEGNYVNDGRGNLNLTWRDANQHKRSKQAELFGQTSARQPILAVRSEDTLLAKTKLFGWHELQSGLARTILYEDAVITVGSRGLVSSGKATKGAPLTMPLPGRKLIFTGQGINGGDLHLYIANSDPVSPPAPASRK